MNIKHLKTSATLVLSSVALVVFADTPLAPPAQHEVESPAHKYVATLDSKTGVEVRARGSSQILWTSTNWSEFAYLADDGNHFVTSYGNLIPLDYSKDLVLLTFWERDKKIKAVTVGELIPNKRILVRTVSHYHWGDIAGITNRILIVNRCDGKKLQFDIFTGKIGK